MTKQLNESEFAGEEVEEWEGADAYLAAALEDRGLSRAELFNEGGPPRPAIGTGHVPPAGGAEPSEADYHEVGPSAERRAEGAPRDAARRYQAARGGQRRAWWHGARPPRRPRRVYRGWGLAQSLAKGSA